ncbi:PAS domain S-box protein [Polynucleobacter sp. AP-Melu-500A-A1]|uniref:PAS domain S-box protein n=1 Tax=Polynucleobacter sp. AP-Melu-500A-A1 TaxID=2576929 RepID=UPI001C0BED64|nr:PAS domain S-box protein [Polynucleobacter sp. AP-Melu-500A-A1]MBU3631661.1 PAS domain S-box protein [Polynucleobacter sp. AP-Melu-500A-A1]
MRDLSARFWILGSLSMAAGCLLFIFKESAPVVLSIAIASFFVFYANLLFAYGIQAISGSKVERKYPYELGLLLYCSLFILAISLGYQNLIPLITIGAGAYTCTVATLALYKTSRLSRNAYVKSLILLYASASIVWLLGMPILYWYGGMAALTNLVLVGSLVLAMMLIYPCLVQGVYIAMRISEFVNNPLQWTVDSPVASFIVEVSASQAPSLRFASNRFTEILGIPKTDIQPQFAEIIQMFHPEERDRFQAAIYAAYQGNKNFFWEGRGLIHDKNRWFRIESSPLKNVGGLTYHQGVITDISTQKIAETELQALQQETQQILKELPIPLIWSSLKEDGITLFVNTRFTEVFGYTLADIPKTEDWMIRAYPDRSYRSVVLAWWRTKVAQAIKDKSSIPSRELKMVTKDGKMLDVLMRATIVQGLLSVSFLDITDRKMAEGLALTLTENIPVGTYVMEVKADRSSRLNFVSKRFIQQFGIQASAAKANPNLVFEKIHPEDYEEFMALHAKALQEKKRFYQEVRVLIRNKVHWFSFEAVPRNALDDLMIWEGVTADITDRKEAERLSTQQAIDIYAAQQELLRLKQVEELNASLKKTIEEKNLLLKSSTTVFKANSMGNMMRSVAHEINNPLGAISLNTELLDLEINALKDQLPANTQQKLDDLVKAILSDGKRAGGVVTRLRKLFVYGEDNYAVFNLSDLVGDITHILQNELIEHDITLNAQIVPHCEMYGDNGQIQMVVLNALNNAIYAIKEQALPKTIELKLSQTDEQICIECQDNGPGFPEDFIQKGPGIFQTSKKEGMGVGLWLSKTIVENHHGSLEIQNNVNGGAMLLIQLPQAKVMQNKPENER